MAKVRFLARILVMFILILCPDSVFGQRILTTTLPANESTNLQVSPTVSPVNQSDTNPIDAVKPEKEKTKDSQLTDKPNNTNGTKTLPDYTDGAVKKDDGSVKSSALNNADDKNSTNGAGKKDNDVKPIVSDDKNGTKVDEVKGVEVNATTKSSSSNVGSCEGSLASCRDKEMVACIEGSKDGSNELFLLVLNGGESTLKVDVNVPNPTGSPLLIFEVPKHETKRMHIQSTSVGKITDLIVNSETAKCTLTLVRPTPVSVDYFVQQLSFYSRQVTPIYGAYTFFVLVILFGGTWACCKFRKKSRQDGIPYQELEMGLPESASAVNVDAADGWDHDWDDDWDEENAVRSPGGNQVRNNISADGLTSRSPKVDGWENDWDD